MAVELQEAGEATRPAAVAAEAAPEFQAYQASAATVPVGLENLATDLCPGPVLVSALLGE